MESQAARRRVNMIAAHFLAGDDISAAATNFFPMNCSSSLNSVIPRRDNRMIFARQGSSSQACFMRQASTEQSVFEQDSCAHSGMPLKDIVSSIERFGKYCEEPMFSRPVVQDSRVPMPDPPRFARPNCGGISGNQMYSSKKNSHAFEPYEWSPRMDVGEYRYNYVLVVELPGVSTKDIKVEVNNKSLIVKGKRSTELWKVAACNSDDSISAYHKKEILQGPYHVVWALPSNVDKDNVSAEFVDGLLRITVLKL